MVITEDAVYSLGLQSKHEAEIVAGWQLHLDAVYGFSPVQSSGAPIEITDPINPKLQIMVETAWASSPCTDGPLPGSR